MKSKERLVKEFALLTLITITICVVVALYFGIGALALFIAGAIASWFNGVACMAIGIVKDTNE